MTAATMTIDDITQGLSVGQERANTLQAEIDGLNEALLGVAFDAFAGDELAMQRRAEIEELIARKTVERDDVYLAIAAGMRKLSELEAEQAAERRAEDLAEANRLDAAREVAFQKFDDALAVLTGIVPDVFAAEMHYVMAANRAGLHTGLSLQERLTPHLLQRLAKSGINLGPVYIDPQFDRPLAKRA